LKDLHHLSGTRFPVRDIPGIRGLCTTTVRHLPSIFRSFKKSVCMRRLHFSRWSYCVWNGQRR